MDFSRSDKTDDPKPSPGLLQKRSPSQNDLNTNTAATMKSKPIPINHATPSPLLDFGRANTSTSSRFAQSAPAPKKPIYGSLQPDSSFLLMPPLELPPSPVTKSHVEMLDKTADDLGEAILEAAENPTTQTPHYAMSAPSGGSSMFGSKAVLHQMKIPGGPRARTSSRGFSASFKAVLTPLHEASMAQHRAEDVSLDDSEDEEAEPNHDALENTMGDLQLSDDEMDQFAME